MKNNWRKEGWKAAAVLSLVLGPLTLVHNLAPHYAAAAGLNTPTTADGVYLAPPDAPCIPFSMNSTTGTREAAIRTSGPGYLTWVQVGTTTSSGSFATFKDTGSVNNTGITQHRIHWTQSDTGKIFEFRPPIRFTNGLVLSKNAGDDILWGCTRLYYTQNP